MIHKRALVFLLAVSTVLLLVASRGRAEETEVEDTDVIVECETSKGSLEIIVRPRWAPKGAERFLQLVRDGYFDGDVPLFRCVNDFLCQFGYLPDREQFEESIVDDPKVPEALPFKRGYVSYAGNGPNSRSSHLFFTLGENVESLGKESWETPIGFISEPSLSEVLPELNTAYGDMPPWGNGPSPQDIQSKGLAYLQENFPELDYIERCFVQGEEEDDYEQAGDAYGEGEGLDGGDDDGFDETNEEL